MKSFFVIVLVTSNAIVFAQGGIGIAGTQGMKQFNKTASTDISASAHYIGQNFGGGVVFYLDAGGQHGLIAEIQDQSFNCNWYNAKDSCAKSDNHSISGDNYSDWRLPTKNELKLLFEQRYLIGGFAK